MNTDDMTVSECFRDVPERQEAHSPVQLFIHGDEGILDDNSDFLSDVLGCSDDSESNSSFSPNTTPESDCSRARRRNGSSTKCLDAADTKKARPPLRTKKQSRSSSTASIPNPEGIDGSIHAAETPPKKPLSAYVLFFKTVRDNNLAAVKKRHERMMNMGTLLRTVEEKWKALHERERRVYEYKATVDILRYEREWKEYHQRLDAIKVKEEFVRARKKARASSCTGQDNIDLSRSVGRSSPAFQNLTTVDNFLSMGVAAASPSPVQQPGPIDPTHVRLQQQLEGAQQPQHTTSLRHLPLPPGMTIELDHGEGRTRRYQVQYTHLSMTVAQAEEYIHHNFRSHIVNAPPPGPSGNQWHPTTYQSDP